MRGKPSKPFVWALLAGTAIGMAAGCSISGSSNVHRSGATVDEDAFARIQLGKTTAKEVRSLLGEPNESKVQTDGVEVWTWHYVEHKESSGEFLILKGSDNKNITEDASIELKDGIVTAKHHNCSSDASHSG